jgi:transcriptional regulator
MPRYTPNEEIDLLADADLLTERQAEIYVYRRIEAVPRPAVADELGIAEQTVSNTATRAGEIIDAAEATLDVLDEIRNQVPDECSECGTALAGKFVTVTSGAALCLSCADVEADDF